MTTNSIPNQGPERKAAHDFLRVGRLEIPYTTRAQAIAAIDRSLDGAGPIRVAFCNANTMLQTLNSSDYARAFDDFLVLNDGVGVDFCSRLLNGRRFEENLNGTDFVPAMLRESRHAYRIFLLGGKAGVAEDAAARLLADHSRHAIVGVRDGYFSDQHAADVVAEINRSGADLVLVALGNPRQEEFVAAHGPQLEAPVVVMVGALFDFLAGRVTRAPKLVRVMRAEWIFRLMQEPRRLGRRYTVDVVRFIAAIGRLRVQRRAIPALSRRRLRPES